VLVAGWLVAVPVPFLLMWAPTWNWVLGANLLLGISQGLTWSTTVIMKIDLVGPRQRGLAMGLNEFAGYVALAASALATGWIAVQYGLRPQPFYHGVGFAIIGLALSAFLVPGNPSPPPTRIRPRRRAASRGCAHTPPDSLAHDVGRHESVERQSGRARQQPERPDGLEPVPAGVRRSRDGPGAFGLAAAMWVIAALTFVSGAVSATRMVETLPPGARSTSRAESQSGTPMPGSQSHLAINTHRPD
jgi:MFS family permease